MMINDYEIVSALMVQLSFEALSKHLFLQLLESIFIPCLLKQRLYNKKRVLLSTQIYKMRCSRSNKDVLSSNSQFKLIR